MTKPTERTGNHVKQWLLELFTHSKESSLESPTVSLSRFGIKNASDIKKFLRSPEGKVFTAELIEEIALEEKIEEEQQFEMEAHELLKSRFKLALILEILNQKAHSFKELVALIEEQEKVAIEHLHQKTETPTTQAVPSPEELAKAYDSAINKAQEQQEELTKEEQHLVIVLDTLLKDDELLEAKYKIYEDHLNEAHFKDFDQHLPNYIAGNIKNNPIAKALESFSNKAKKLHAEIKKHIEHHRDARLSMHKLEALTLQHQALNQMLAIRKQYQLIEENGKVYLLKPDQNWETVKNNPQMKQDANKAIEQYVAESKLEVINIISSHKKLESDDQAQKVLATKNQIINNKVEQTFIGNLISVLHASRSNLEAAKRRTDPTFKLTPSPTVTGKPNLTPAPAPRPAPRTTKDYKIELQQAQFQPLNYIPANNANLPPSNRREKDAAFNKKLRIGAPLFSQEFSALLTRLHQIGVSNRGPIVTVDPQKETSTNLNPLNLRPYKK
jgi:hypothetical protein